VVFDVGGVLLDWDPRHLYRKLFAEEAEMEWFLAEICSPAWHAPHDRGVANCWRERVILSQSGVTVTGPRHDGGVMLSEWARLIGVSCQSATRWFHAGVLPVAARQLRTGMIVVDEPVGVAAGVAV